MKTLRDLRDYAKRNGLSNYNIERLIDETETDADGNVIDYDNICLSIDCEIETLMKIKSI